MNGQSEGDALNDWYSSCEVENDRQENREVAMAATREQMRKRYAAAETAKVGNNIQCAFCGRRVVKTTYHKRFCTNGTTRKGGNCKDRYWNSVDYNRSERAKQWQR